MRTRRTVRVARVARIAVLVGAAALLAGCVRMPTSGPVVESEGTGSSEDAPGISFDPRPPQAGQATAEIVEGFFEAMKATPVSVSVARQFLSREAAETWVPERQIITYAELGEPTAGTSVRVQLSDVNSYDARGAWQRTRGGADLSLDLVKEDGEWRIDEVPDALIVPATWFDDWYERASLYYFDPTTEIMVPISNAEPNITRPNVKGFTDRLPAGFSMSIRISRDTIRMVCGFTPGMGTICAGRRSMRGRARTKRASARSGRLFRRRR